MTYKVVCKKYASDYDNDDVGFVLISSEVVCENIARLNTAEVIANALDQDLMDTMVLFEIEEVQL